MRRIALWVGVSLGLVSIMYGVRGGHFHEFLAARLESVLVGSGGGYNCFDINSLSPAQAASCREAALNADPDEQFFIGRVFKSLGGKQNYPEAETWYRKAAEQGHAGAQNALGGLMLIGIGGVPQDLGEAEHWFRRAAEKGDGAAQGSLGFMYHAGLGIPQNTTLAYLWYDIAGANGNTFAETWMKARAADHMTPAQIADAQRLAREWKPKTWEELQGQLER